MTGNPEFQVLNADAEFACFPDLADADAVFGFALDALDYEFDDKLVEWMDAAASRHSRNARIQQVCALLLRDAGRQEEAIAAFSRAAELAPSDDKIALGLAQSVYEAGLPATRYYQTALAMSPNRAAVIPGLAAAYCALGRYEEALREVEAQLRRTPDWLDGHWLYARINWIAGDAKQILRTVDGELANASRHPGLLRLRTAILLAAERYEDALASAMQANGILRHDASALFDVAICQSETWHLANAEIAFRSLPALDEPAAAVHLVRHWLRSGRPELVDAVVAKLAPYDDKQLLQPYLSLAWRCLADNRWQQLERVGSDVGVYDLSAEWGDIRILADRLRSIHTGSVAPMEQSLRGGTQTDGPLLSRIEPEIVALRDILRNAAKRHLETVRASSQSQSGPHEHSQTTLRFAGSWSVRLTSGGRHVSHTHPGGYYSSALYVQVPEETGVSDAGSLTLGAPPPNLGIKLDPLRVIKPAVGTLVLFPSTLWHGTLPFEEGERITVAFDIARPRPNILTAAHRKDR